MPSALIGRKVGLVKRVRVRERVGREMYKRLAAIAVLFGWQFAALGETPQLARIRVSKDGKGFELVPSGKKFIPWGFNYDHDAKGRLIEDYWDTDWDAIKGDFAEMKALGANVVRIHIQFG